MHPKRVLMFFLIIILATSAAADNFWVKLYKGTINKRISLIEFNGKYTPTGMQEAEWGEPEPDPDYPTKCDKETFEEFRKAIKEVASGLRNDKIQKYKQEIEKLQEEVSSEGIKEAIIEELQDRIDKLRKPEFWESWICHGFGDFYTIESCIERLKQLGYPDTNARMICGDCSNKFKDACEKKGTMFKPEEVREIMGLPYWYIEKKMKEEKKVGYIEQEGKFSDARCSMPVGEAAGRPQCLKEYCMKIQGGTKPLWECSVPAGIDPKTGRAMALPTTPRIQPPPSAGIPTTEMPILPEDKPQIVRREPPPEELPTIPIEIITIPETIQTPTPQPTVTIPKPEPLDCGKKFPGMDILNVKGKSECERMGSFLFIPNQQICTNYRVEVSYYEKGTESCCARKITTTTIPGCTQGNWGGWTQAGQGIVQSTPGTTPGSGIISVH